MNLKELLGSKLIDTHCHINERVFDRDRVEAIAAAQAAGVEEIWDIGIDIPTSKLAVAIAYRNSGVKALVGIDPALLVPGGDLYMSNLLQRQDAEFETYIQESLDSIRFLVEQNKDVVVGIGEIGMDTYYLDRSLTDGTIEKTLFDLSKARQLQLFQAQLALAEELGVPVSVHTRGCEAECAEIIKDYPNLQGIFHSYTGDLATARQVLAQGWLLGVNGIFTYKNSADIRQMYKQILLDQGVTKLGQPSDLYAAGLVLETDAPYLAPDNKRGERNEPVNIQYLWQFLQNWWAREVA
jgi:TatD DNase family protein